jgi:hypothetical protein
MSCEMDRKKSLEWMVGHDYPLARLLNLKTRLLFYSFISREADMDVAWI